SKYWLSFPKLIPKRIDKIPEATYCFWVGTDDRPSPPPEPFCKFVGAPTDGKDLPPIELRKPW
ncbi:MAG TPA: hypothetical protein VN476_18940, partial [Pyrinomonadaceae bacterium]|nr:hypothetical protein [Pyrinomonadaceae bacterium]